MTQEISKSPVAMVPHQYLSRGSGDHIEPQPAPQRQLQGRPPARPSGRPQQRIETDHLRKRWKTREVKSVMGELQGGFHKWEYPQIIHF